MYRILRSLLPHLLLLLAACQERSAPAPRAEGRGGAPLLRSGAGELLGCAPLLEAFEEHPQTSVELHVDRRGTPWLAYDVRGRERPGVYVASNSTGTWRAELVHGLPNAWVDDLHVDAHGVPHVLYTDMSAPRVMYATRAPGRPWVIQSIGEGYGEALTIDARGLVHIVHRTREGGSVYVRRAPEREGSTEVVDRLTRPSHISLALDGEERVQVAYIASRSTQLFHAVRVGPEEWRRTLVATRVGEETFHGVDLALGPRGEPVVAWVTSEDVLYLAEHTGGTWRTAPVLERVDYLRKVSLAIDAGGNHHVGYMHTDYSAAYATNREGPWRHLPLLAASFAPASLALTPAGQPALGVLSSSKGLVGVARPCPFHALRPRTPGAPSTRGLAAP